MTAPRTAAPSKNAREKTAREKTAREKSARGKTVQVLGLAGWLVVRVAAAGVGAGAAVRAGAFHEGLARPVWAPPAWLFGPVWTALYALTALAAWLVWRDGGFREHRAGLGLFVGQLAVNAL